MSDGHELLTYEAHVVGDRKAIRRKALEDGPQPSLCG
jgi:hypothetical protein